MPIDNAEVAAVFNEIADLLEIQGANPFRIRAYRNAARNIEGLSKSVQAMVERGDDLDALPGVGKDLAGKIIEIVATGTCALRDRLRRELPPAITDLLKIPGLGPKRVMTLHQELGIESLEQLFRAARDGRIRAVPGFGEKTEQQILHAVQVHASRSTRFKLARAAQVAEPLLAWLKGAEGVDDVAVAGSYRRMRETVGDLDILVTSSTPGAAVKRFVGYEDVLDVMAKGITRASVRLRSGVQVDLRVVARESFGAALVYFTGSKAHNIAIRKLGQERGLKINEYGVFRGDDRIAGDTEASVYRSIGLPLIPPELREDQGEIGAARAGRLPDLIDLADVKGDLHCHTTASDGQNSLREMVQAAKARGLSYLAITEHSQRLAMAHGLDAARLAKQIDEIDLLNTKTELKDFTVLKGIEVDILPDGSLDLPDTILSRLDIVVGAIHSKFELSRAAQTERIVRAMANPYLTMLAHPTGRMIAEREPYDVDMQRVVKEARLRGCCLELNAHPERLDLFDTHCRMAKAEGVLISVNSDAHSTLELDNLRFGIGQARRGWLEARDVLNTRPAKEVRSILKGSRKALA